MIYPNIECYYLCVWMTDVSAQRLTGPQTTLTNVIKAAALANTGVTVNQWQDFNNYAGWRNPFYLVYRDYQIYSNVDLNSGLINYYDFEGNSNDLVGSINGTNTNITFSNSYGLIGQGARNTSTNGNILLGSASTFQTLLQTGVFTLNIWMRQPSTTQQNLIWAWNLAGGSKGAYLLNQQNSSIITVCYNPAYASGWSWIMNTPSPSNDTSWHMYTCTGDGVYLYFYFDGILITKARFKSFITGSPANAFYLFNLLGASSYNPCDLDEFGIWSRLLNIAEVHTLYNSGAGLTYPF